jgi:predicted PurR-regulated permease PerM
VDSLQVKMEQHWPAVETYWTEHDLTHRLKDAMEQHGAVIAQSLTSMTGFALEAWGSVFRSVAGLLSWFILPIYLGFFLLGEPVTKEQFEGVMPFLKASTRKDISYLAFEFVEILVSFFRGQMLIALFQGLLFATGFAIIGLDYGFTLGLALGFLNVIPYLGSMVGLSIGLPLAFFQPGGGPMTVVLVLVVFTVVQCIEGYLLTPKIMGDRTGLHPLAIIIAIFFWGSVFGGITGMILAIPLTAFLVVLWRLLKTKYITELM